MKKHIDNDKILDAMEIDINNNAVSHFEATGLMPTPADDEYERDSYESIFNYKQRPISHKEKHTNH